MSWERGLNFDQWKTFSENSKPVRVWLWFAYKFIENYCRLRLFSEFIQTQKRYSYLSWQNTYPNLKTTCRIKLKFLLWTKLPENLILTKYFISVAAPLKSTSGQLILFIYDFFSYRWVKTEKIIYTKNLASEITVLL